MSFLVRSILLLGGAGSFALVLYVGRHNHSLLLQLLFALWVPAPFMALSVLHRRSQRWTTNARLILETVALVLTLISLAAYARVAFGPPRPRPAGTFLVVPALSWIVIAATALLCRNLSAEN